MNRIFCCVLVSLSSVCGVPAKVVVKGEIVERDGIARKATVLEQGIPVEGLSDSEAKGLVMAGPDGKVLPGSIEVEARDEHGRPRWLRLAAVVAIPAGGRLPVTVETGSPVRAGNWRPN